MCVTSALFASLNRKIKTVKFQSRRHAVNLERCLTLILVLCMAFIAAFREDSVGIDTPSYQEIYMTVGAAHSYSAGLRSVDMTGFLYILLCRILYHFSKTPHTITFFTSLIVNAELYLLVRRVSWNSVTILYLWQVLLFFPFSMNGNRQTIAMLLMLHACLSLYRNFRAPLAWGLVVLAVGVHPSMLCMTPLLFSGVAARKIGDKRIGFCLSACAGAAAYKGMFSAANLIVRFYPHYAQYVSGENTIFSTNGRGRIIYLYMFFLGLMFLWCFQKRRPNERQSAVFQMYPALTAMLVFGTFSTQSMIVSRVVLCYMSALLFLIPDLLDRLKGFHRFFARIIIMSLLFLYYMISLLENQNGVTPYALHWAVRHAP